MVNRTPILGYESKKDAAIALHLEGNLSVNEIAEKVGSKPDNVRLWLAKAAAAGATPAAPWTEERTRKARRLFARTIHLIAESMTVTPHELITRGLKGVIAPLGRTVDRVHELLEQMAADDAVETSSPAADDVLDQAAADRDTEEQEQIELTPSAPRSGEDANRLGDPVPPSTPQQAMPAADTEVDAEPSREDDEAELAALDDDADDEDEPKSEGGDSEPLFFLKSEAGDFLHEHEGGMTRLPRFYWRGTAVEANRLQRRKPHLKQLDRVRAR